MCLDLFSLQTDFPDLTIIPENREKGATAYRLRLPAFSHGREFAWAELLLPRGFPEHASAKIILSQDAVLRIPHVDQAGALCIEGDPGPEYGCSAEDRVLLLLNAYQEQFLIPWLNGKLDGHFSDESLNYWQIKVSRARSARDPVRYVWTVDPCPSRASVKEGVLLLPSRIVIANNDQEITSRIIKSLGINAAQRIKVLVAEIPIAFPFTPSTWPNNASDLDRLLSARLRPVQYEEFQRPLRQRGRDRGVHRVILLRYSAYSYAYLLPGGPPTSVIMETAGVAKKTVPAPTKPIPLEVDRIDPSWTVGRDQHSEVGNRQSQHVLILGAGALGSFVVEHLAKAGVGQITLVDPDILTAANIGRHLLGVDSVNKLKAKAVAERVNLGYPATTITPKVMSAAQWFQKNDLSSVDYILDITGESDVRRLVERTRQEHACPLLIGWMEPFAAAAHVCLLPRGISWLVDTTDPMKSLEAVSWPTEVIRQEPGCSSRFQSYTAAAAAHAVALVTENALKLIDGSIQAAQVSSWVRGQRFLDGHWYGLTLLEWAKPASPYDGLVIERVFP